MIWYLNLLSQNKISIHKFALSFTQEFSLAVLCISKYFDISRTTLFLLIKIVQGVCSCFSLFNLQGTPLRSQPIQSHVTVSSAVASAAWRLIYYSTRSFVCQELFSTFFKFFSFATRLPQVLRYFSTKVPICQALFSLFLKFFKKSTNCSPNGSKPQNIAVPRASHAPDTIGTSK